MGNWSFAGIAITVGLFLMLFGFLLSQINITNPLTGVEVSIWSTIFNWILP